MNEKEKKALKLSQLNQLTAVLESIDELVDEIPECDPFGDMDENFKEEDKDTNITVRLLEMVDDEKVKVRRSL